MAHLDEQFYDFLIEEDEPRACEAIPEEACTNLKLIFRQFVYPLLLHHSVDLNVPGWL